MPRPRNYRLVDLSLELTPAVRKDTGEYIHGRAFLGERIVELEELRFAGGFRMHKIHAETHIGTHVESPYKEFDNGKTLSELPLETFAGEALVVHLEHLRGGPVRPEFLKNVGVKKGDIVLLRGPSGEYEAVDKPYLTKEAMEWLIQKKVKMIGVMNADYDKTYVPGKGNTALMLKKDIPILDFVTNLESLRRDRFFLVAFPIRISRMEASPTRVVAFEEA